MLQYSHQSFQAECLTETIRNTYIVLEKLLESDLHGFTFKTLST